MKLIWKLLRQHISVAQFVGFFFANLVGMLIILLGVQFYTDTQAVYNGEDSFMRPDFIIVNKPVSTVASYLGASSGFSEDEIEDLKEQDFVEELGSFTPSNFEVSASFRAKGMASFSTEMFFESVPDNFVDVVTEEWTYSEGDKRIPIILPRNYLDLYNFGFAQSRNLPELSEGILGMVNLQITIGGRYGDNYEGRIAGFSSRLNTILVPESFMKWANGRYGTEDDSGRPTRLIMKVKNPTDENITAYLNEKGYVTDQDKLDASKTTFVLRVIVGIVMGVGAIICILSFYILMLSVYLLVQKNSDKLQNLLLIGYSTAKVSLPYQFLTIGLNIAVFILAFVILLVVRGFYMNMFVEFFPDVETPTLCATFIVGGALLLFVSCMNVIVVRRKISSLWRAS